MTNNRPPLTVQETMRALGVSDSTVRRMLKEGVLREVQPRRGPIHIDPTTVDAAAVSLGRAELAGGEMRRELAPTMNTLAEVVSSLAETIQQQQDRIADLALQLGEARAEARLLPAKADMAEQRAAMLEEQLDHERQENQRLRDELARLQRMAGDYAGDKVTRQSNSGAMRTLIGRLLRRG
jgi:excisionase family DNA binding protein